MRKIFLLILLPSLLLASCGRKGPLTYEGKREQPDFSKISDELDKDKIFPSLKISDENKDLNLSPSQQ